MNGEIDVDILGQDGLLFKVGYEAMTDLGRENVRKD